MFAYSEREGTVAARKMPDTVPESLKQSRLSELIAVQRKINAEVSAAAVGTRQRVLVESVSKRSADEFLARTETFQSVIIPGQGLALGDLLTVDITGTTSATLIGVPVSTP
jgi:tRNA-2-methylthio-N6-dimethylallyladenosine synthase